MSIKNKNKLNRYSKKSTNYSTKSGFTIVELLVVITIIGILATIIILFYIGTHQKAIDTALQSDLKGASTQLELDRVSSELYPTNIGAANNGKGLKASPDTAYNYIPANGDSTYCLEASREGRTWYIDSTAKIPIRGTCAGGPADDGGGSGGNPAANDSYARTWGGTGMDWGTSIIKTVDGGYAMTGLTESYGAGTQDALIAKYTSEGDLLWSRTWGGTGNDSARSIVQATDGSFVIAGETWSFGNGWDDVFIAKYTSEGDLLWSRTWGGTNFDVCDSLIQTNDGGFAITGKTESYGAGGDSFFVKYNVNGDLLWNKTWGGGYSDGGTSIIQTDDDEYIIASDTFKVTPSVDRDASLTKFDPNGNMLWNKTWGDVSDYSRINSVITTSDGGFAITGETRSYGAGSEDVFLAKFAANGDLSWNKTWGGGGVDAGRDLIQTNDSGYIVAGQTNSFGAGNNDSLLIKYNPSGDLSWNKTWGGGSSDWGYSVIQTSNGGYAVTGGTESYGAGNYDMFLLKYAADGSIDSCLSSMCQDQTANTTSPSITTANPAVNQFSPTINATSPTATVTSPTATVKNLVVIQKPTPPMTITFSAQELYVAYPGESQTTCKEWTVPNGKTIKGFKVSQESESNYDYFTVSLNGVEVYSDSGSIADKYTDTSETPGTTLNACMSADSSVQNGYGGEVTGVVYN